MARPFGTSQFPEDEPILDEIEKDLEARVFTSRTAAIKEHLRRANLERTEARVRRFLRKLKLREQEKSTDEQLVDLLSDALLAIPTRAQRFEYLSSIERAQRELPLLAWRSASRLERAGIDLRGELGPAILKAFMRAESKKPGL